MTRRSRERLSASWIRLCSNVRCGKATELPEATVRLPRPLIVTPLSRRGSAINPLFSAIVGLSGDFSKKASFRQPGPKREYVRRTFRRQLQWDFSQVPDLEEFRRGATGNYVNEYRDSHVSRLGKSFKRRARTQCHCEPAAGSWRSGRLARAVDRKPLESRRTISSQTRELGSHGCRNKSDLYPFSRRGGDAATDLSGRVAS